MKKFLLFILAILTPAFISAQQIIHVPDVYLTIQEAIDAAGYGDTILVDTGRYTENVIIQGNNKVVTLASHFIFSADTNDINNTIIDGSNPINPDYGMVVMFKNQDTTLMPKIIGFTLTGGTGYYKAYGGGIYSNLAIPVIEYNHIVECSVTGTQPHGAGIRVGQGLDTNKVCLIRYNVIRNCTINAAANTIAADGAGISLDRISAILEGNTISNNFILGNTTSDAFGSGILYYMSNNYYHTAQVLIKNNVIANNGIESNGAYGGGVFFQDDFGYTRIILEGNTIADNDLVSLGLGGEINGGGIFLRNPAVGSNISGNAINNNHADEGPQGQGWGGGMFITYELNPGGNHIMLIEKNRITQNSAAFNGGGISCSYLGLKMVNNFISGNQAEIRAGGIYLGGQSSSPVLSFINNTFTGNYVTGQNGAGGSIYFSDYPGAVLMNNIFFNNQAPEGNELYNNNLSTVDIHYCDINPDDIIGIWTGGSNFYADPEFIDDTCHIDQYSQCEDQGADSIYIDGTWYYAPISDFEGTPRPYHMGIDIGADECDIIENIPGPGININNLVQVQSYPNPFTGTITIEYELLLTGNVNLTICNYLGQAVAELVNSQQDKGKHMITWNAECLQAGIYFYRLSSVNDQRSTGKLVLK
jgi:hypothetical protein